MKPVAPVTRTRAPSSPCGSTSRAPARRRAPPASPTGVAAASGSRSRPRRTRLRVARPRVSRAAPSPSGPRRRSPAAGGRRPSGAGRARSPATGRLPSSRPPSARVIRRVAGSKMPISTVARSHADDERVAQLPPPGEDDAARAALGQLEVDLALRLDAAGGVVPVRDDARVAEPPREQVDHVHAEVDQHAAARLLARERRRRLGRPRARLALLQVDVADLARASPTQGATVRTVRAGTAGSRGRPRPPGRPRPRPRRSRRTPRSCARAASRRGRGCPPPAATSPPVRGGGWASRRSPRRPGRPGRRRPPARELHPRTPREPGRARGRDRQARRARRRPPPRRRAGDKAARPRRSRRRRAGEVGGRSRPAVSRHGGAGHDPTRRYTRTPCSSKIRSHAAARAASRLSKAPRASTATNSTSEPSRIAARRRSSPGRSSVTVRSSPRPKNGYGNRIDGASFSTATEVALGSRGRNAYSGKKSVPDRPVAERMGGQLEDVGRLQLRPARCGVERPGRSYDSGDGEDEHGGDEGGAPPAGAEAVEQEEDPEHAHRGQEDREPRPPLVRQEDEDQEEWQERVHQDVVASSEGVPREDDDPAPAEPPPERAEPAAPLLVRVVALEPEREVVVPRARDLERPAPRPRAAP